MIDLERIKKAIDWLVFDGSVKNKRELADVMGYSESSLSQILNKKVPLSDNFIKKLAIVNDSLSLDWLLTGEGEMLRKDESAKINNSSIVSIPADVWDVIKNQAESLKNKDAQMNEMIGMLRDEMKKKYNAEKPFRVANLEEEEEEV